MAVEVCWGQMWSGGFRSGEAVQVCWGLVSWVTAYQGMAVEVTQVEVWQGKAGYGVARRSGLDKFWRGELRLGGLGEFGFGEVRLGTARRSRCVVVWRSVARCG
jgi:hypothetical protein